MTAEKNSYGQVLRSSSIVGGAQAANYLIMLARVKLVAMLLGPTGVGLVGLYTSALGLVGTVSGMGVSSSAVREVARAQGKNDPEEAARAVIILRRMCWATGLLGWGIAVLLREPISVTMTGSPDHASDIAWLGATILIGAISGGQLAHLQGMRRIGDLARSNVMAAVIGSALSVAIYFALGQAGIIPALIAAALASLGCSFWFSRRLEVSAPSLSWRETSSGFRRLATLGLAFMWSGCLVAGLDMFTRSLIARHHGIEAAGIYQAAWALSGLFANFVLAAMGTDFYPRLTAAIHDREHASRIVNEQTEIGILLALPGLIAVLAFAPIAIKLIYTPQFLPAAGLLPWMALGVFCRVVCYPLAYVQLALGASTSFAATETIGIAFEAGAMLLLVERYGTLGAAYASTLTYTSSIPVMLWVARGLIGFSWSSEARQLILASAIFVCLAFGVRFLCSDTVSLVADGALSLAAALFSLRELAKRLGEGNRFVRWARMVPGGRAFLSGVFRGA